MNDEATRRGTIAGLLAASVAGLGAAALASEDREAPDSSGSIVLGGRGIDPTGARDSSSAVQALLDGALPGSTVVNPSGAVLRLDRGLTVRHEGTRLTGTGEWRFRAGAEYSVDPDAQEGFIDLRADHCRIDGIRATNPDGVRNRGLVVLADHCTVDACTLVGFGQGITVSPAGEFHSTVVTGNHVIDVLGDGGGPDDTGDAGESYGDGIVSWGAASVIRGNVVSCREGSDARIGIHVEALPSQSERPWVHDHRLAVISGNIVTGRFRRGIVSEGVHHAVISGNAIADATWWSIALISADHCVVTGNTVRSTRTSRDTQGSWWSPVHAAIALVAVDAQHPVRDPLVVDNTIDVPAGAEAVAGVALLGNAADAVAVRGGRIAGNRISAEGGLQHGILAQRRTAELDIEGNRLSGAALAGVALGDADSPAVRTNRITAGAPSAIGIEIEGRGTVVVEQNRVRSVDVGIRMAGESTVVVRDNLLLGVRVPLDLRTPTGSTTVEGNRTGSSEAQSG